MRQLNLLQRATTILLQSTTSVITKCDRYYKVRWLLQSATEQTHLSVMCCFHQQRARHKHKHEKNEQFRSSCACACAYAYVWWNSILGFHVTWSPPCWWTVNNRSLISSFFSSTSICPFHHCYLAANHLFVLLMFLCERLCLCLCLCSVYASENQPCVVQRSSSLYLNKIRLL